MNEYETENKSLIDEYVKQQLNQARQPTLGVSCTYSLNKLPKTDIIVFFTASYFSVNIHDGEKKKDWNLSKNVCLF